MSICHDKFRLPEDMHKICKHAQLCISVCGLKCKLQAKLGVYTTVGH